MPWDNPNSTDNLMDTKPGSLLDSCRRAIYERMKAAFFDRNYYFDVDIDTVPEDPRFYTPSLSAPEGSLYRQMLRLEGRPGQFFSQFTTIPADTTHNYFHELFKRSVPQVINSFAQDISPYVSRVNDSTGFQSYAIARYEYKEGISPPEESWASGNLFIRTFLNNPRWSLVSTYGLSADHFHAKNPYFIPLLGKPQSGDYVIQLWRRLYQLTLMLTERFIDMTPLFTDWTVKSLRYDISALGSKTLGEYVDLIKLKYRAPFEVRFDRTMVGQVEWFPQNIRRITTGKIAREVVTGKYYKYIGPDYDSVTNFLLGPQFTRDQFVEVTDRVINDPHTITEVHTAPPINPYTLSPMYLGRYPYAPTEPGAYFGLHIVQDMVRMLKLMKYTEERVGTKGHVNGDGYFTMGSQVFPATVNKDFNTANGDQSYGGFGWSRHHQTGSNVSIYWQSVGGSFFIADAFGQPDRPTYVGIPATEHIYATSAYKPVYNNPTIYGGEIVSNVAGQEFPVPPEPPTIPANAGYGPFQIFNTTSKVAGFYEWGFEYQ